MVTVCHPRSFRAEISVCCIHITPVPRTSLAQMRLRMAAWLTLSKHLLLDYKIHSSTNQLTSKSSMSAYATRHPQPGWGRTVTHTYTAHTHARAHTLTSLLALHCAHTKGAQYILCEGTAPIQFRAERDLRDRATQCMPLPSISQMGNRDAEDSERREPQRKPFARRRSSILGVHREAHTHDTCEATQAMQV